MTEDKYVTKQEFEELKKNFNNMCQTLSDLNLKKAVDFYDLQVEDYDEEPEGTNSPTDPDEEW